MKCNKCSNANICLDHIEFPSLSGCTSGIPDRKVPTNADKIRSTVKIRVNNVSTNRKTHA